MKTNKSANSRKPKGPKKASPPTPLQLFEAAKLLGLELTTPDAPFPSYAGHDDLDAEIDPNAMGVTYFSRQLVGTEGRSRRMTATELERVEHVRAKLRIAMGIWGVAQEVIDNGLAGYHRLLEEERVARRTRAVSGGESKSLNEALEFLGLSTSGRLHENIADAGYSVSALPLPGRYPVALLEAVKAHRYEMKRERDRRAKAEQRKREADQAKS